MLLNGDLCVVLGLFVSLETCIQPTINHHQALIKSFYSMKSVKSPIQFARALQDPEETGFMSCCHSLAIVGRRVFSSNKGDRWPPRFSGVSSCWPPGSDPNQRFWNSSADGE